MSLVYVIRHGRTVMNERGCLQGQTDCPLNEAGKEQAQLAGEKLRERGVKITHVFSSPLTRPIETAEIATGISRTEFTLDKRILEMNFGDYEGIPVSELPNEEMDRFFAHPDLYPTPNGEKGTDVVNRVKDFFMELKAYDDEKKLDGTNLISTHGGVMHAIRVFSNHLPIDSFWNVDVFNCEIISVDLQNDFHTEIIFEGFSPKYASKSVSDSKYRN